MYLVFHGFTQNPVKLYFSHTVFESSFARFKSEAECSVVKLTYLIIFKVAEVDYIGF